MSKKISIRFPPGCHTASAAYDHYMSTGCHTAAAQLAFEHGLGEELVHAAALPAVCQLLVIQEFAAARAMMTKYGLPRMNAGDLDYLADMAVRGDLPAQLQKYCFCPGPTLTQ